MVVLAKDYKDFYTLLEKYRPDITYNKNKRFIGTYSKNILTSKLVNSESMLPSSAFIHSYKGFSLEAHPSIVCLWHIPNIFNGKILVDFGTQMDIKDNDILYLGQHSFNGENSSFRLNLTKEAEAFVQKNIDKNIRLKNIDKSNYELVSVGKFGALLTNKYNKYFVLTPIGPQQIKYNANKKIDVMNINIEKLLDINIPKSGWTEDKILELTQKTFTDFNFDM